MTDSLPPGAPGEPLDERAYHSTGRLLRLGLPLVISHISVMAMQLVDTAFLARYSPSDMGAAGLGGMMSYLAGGFFGGTVAFTGTFVAQYLGEGRPRRIGPVVWQGMYWSLAFGALLALLSGASDPIFARLDLKDDLREAASSYFRWSNLGGVFGMLGMCLTGFYAGRNNNRPVLAAQLFGAGVNGVLDWILIFGKFGAPELGVTGAAVATVVGQAAIVAVLGVGFFRAKYRTSFDTWRGRGRAPALALRLLRFGLPQGFRTAVEVALWSVFLYFIGKAGALELAASQVAFRVSTFAFMPAVGLSTALAMLVGQAQGARRPDLSWRALRRGAVAVTSWMAFASALFVAAPRFILTPLMGGGVDAPDAASAEDTRRTMELAVVLLRYVALYCLFDGFNIVFISTLQGAGDTLWTMKASIAAHVLAVGVFALIDRLTESGILWAGVPDARLHGQWIAATSFICLLAGLWAFRLRGRKWERMTVTESPEAIRSNAESQRRLARDLPE